MQLHRADKQPEWEAVPTNERNAWQRVAATTSGFVTPANAITVIGLLIVLFGLQQLLAGEYWVAAGALVVGRLLDIVDGVVADKTGTKGPLGELMDAGADKIGTFITVVALAVDHTAAYWLLAVVVMPQIIIALIVSYITARKQRFHPSRIGKLSMAVAWFGLVGFVVIAANKYDSAVLSIVVTLLAILSGVMASYATIGYLRDARTKLAAS